MTGVTATTPVNTAAPTISGTPSDGNALTASPGTWTGPPTAYTYQWYRDGVLVAGQTASAYAVGIADIGATLTVAVTASNAAGSASATSAGTDITSGLSTGHTLVFRETFAEGTTLTSGSPGSNFGTVTGSIYGRYAGPRIAAGPAGGASACGSVDATGTNPDWTAVWDFSGLAAGAQPIPTGMVCCWIKMDDYVTSAGAITNLFGLQRLSGGTFEMSLRGGVLANATGAAVGSQVSHTPELGRWYYLAFVFDRSVGSVLRTRSYYMRLGTDAAPVLFDSTDNGFDITNFTKVYLQISGGRTFRGRVGGFSAYKLSSLAAGATYPHDLIPPRDEERTAYYVDAAAGNDANAGRSTGTAWATWQKCVDELERGTLLSARAGREWVYAADGSAADLTYTTTAQRLALNASYRAGTLRPNGDELAVVPGTDLPVTARLRLRLAGLTLRSSVAGSRAVCPVFKAVGGTWTQPDSGGSPNVWANTDTQSQIVLWEDRKWLNKPLPVNAATVSNKALTTNVATITTSASHGFSAGSLVTVAGVDSTFNGTFTIVATPSGTTFTYAKTAANVGSAASSGTATSYRGTQASALAALNGTPGSFFTDGTTLYLHCSDSGNPNSNGKVYERSRNITAGAAGALVDSLVAVSASALVKDVDVSGAALMFHDNASSVPAQYHVGSMTWSGYQVFDNVKATYHSKHPTAAVGDGHDAALYRHNVVSGQGLPTTWADVTGTSVPDCDGGVDYSGSNAGNANLVTAWYGCTNPNPVGVVGSAAGTTGGKAYYSHALAPAVNPIALTRMDGCTLAGRVSPNAGNVTRFEIADSTVYGLDYSGVSGGTAAADRCTLTTLPGNCGGGTLTLTDCLVKWVGVVSASTDYDLTGNIVFNSCTLDFSGATTANDNSAPWNLGTGGTLAVADSAVVFPSTAGSPMTLVLNGTTVKTVSLARCAVQPGVSTLLLKSYNDGATTTDRSYAQAVALGLVTASLSQADIKLTLASSAAVQAGSPVIGLATPRANAKDLTGATFATRDDAGCREYVA